MIDLIEDAKISISAGRSQKFFEQTKEVSDYLESLHLSTEQHNKLCNMLVEQLSTAEYDAFRYGVKIAGELAAVMKTAGN